VATFVALAITYIFKRFLELYVCRRWLKRAREWAPVAAVARRWEGWTTDPIVNEEATEFSVSTKSTFLYRNMSTTTCTYSPDSTWVFEALLGCLDLDWPDLNYTICIAIHTQSRLNTPEIRQQIKIEDYVPSPMLERPGSYAQNAVHVNPYASVP
jgi:hypothetical protein